MGTVRLPRREPLEAGIQVAAILVDAGRRACQMQLHPLVEADQRRRGWHEGAPILEP